MNNARETDSGLKAAVTEKPKFWYRCEISERPREKVGFLLENNNNTNVFA